MMPIPVVVRELADDLREHVRSNGLVERRAESSVRHHAELPGSAASVDATVIRRRIRRPSEPGSDGEAGGGAGNRGGRDPVARVEVPRLTKLASDGGVAHDRAVTPVAWVVLHLPVGGGGL